MTTFKTNFLYLLCAVIFFSSCSNSEKNIFSKYLNADNLQTQQFVVDISKGATVTTSGGITVQIPAGAIKADNEKVTLEIKEALNIHDMLKAGLTTESAQGMLASAGMFHISTKEKSSIVKPLKVSVPDDYADPQMQLYKGEEKDGKVTWNNPSPVSQQVSDCEEKGRVLFSQNCASCHAVEKSLTGPALAWMDRRKSREWLYKYIRNNEEVIKSGDHYACCIFHRYRVPMNTFPAFTNDDIDCILNYINSASEKAGVPKDFNPNGICDSCEYYHDYEYKLRLVRDSLIENNGEMTTVYLNPSINASAPDNFNTIYGPIISTTPGNKVAPEEIYAESYSFEIDTYGWFNVDMLLDERKDLQESILNVAIDNASTYRINVFLIIPSINLFQEGGFLDDGEHWGFYTTDGKIKLPPNQQATVFALGEENGKIYFGKKNFVTSSSQTINIELAETTEDKIRQQVEWTYLPGFEFNVSKSKNFEGIKAIDEELAKMPVDCDCGFATDSSAPWLK